MMFFRMLILMQISDRSDFLHCPVKILPKINLVLYVLYILQQDLLFKNYLKSFSIYERIN
jgi:hypothetical protein